jgi:hypothetical protein
LEVINSLKASKSVWSMMGPILEFAWVARQIYLGDIHLGKI